MRRITDETPTALARSARALLLAAALALAVAAAAVIAAPATAAPVADAAAVVAKTTKPNRVVVGVGVASATSEPSFLPLAGSRLQLRLYGRGRLVKAQRLRLRMLPARQACARGRGQAIRTTPGFRGAFSPVAVSAPLRVPRPQARRFCVWSSGSSSARLLGDQKIAFFGSQFGAVIDSSERFFSVDYGTDSDFASWYTEAQATFPIELARSESGCHPDDRGDPLRSGISTRSALASLSSATGVQIGLRGCVPVTDHFAYSGAGGALWSTSYGTDQATSAERPIAHAGACVPGAVGSTSVFDARRIIEAQGCRVGRVIALGVNDGGRSQTAAGAVYSATRNGERVLIAPRGTTLDLLTNGRPESALTGANPLIPPLVRQYSSQLAPGERRLSGTAGPRLANRPGVVLVRFFIPSATAAGGLLKGDGRSFSSDLTQSHRAALLWDTTSGRVDFSVTGSCRKGALGFVFDPHRPCKPALRLVATSRDKVFANSDSRRSTNVVNVGGAAAGTLDARFSLLNSYTNGLPGVAGAWSVDETLTISPAPTPSGFALRMVGNGYPAMEAYWYADQAGALPLTISKRDVETPHVGAFKVSVDGGGGDAALDRVSWATCETTPDGAATRCVDRHNDHRTWVTQHG